MVNHEVLISKLKPTEYFEQNCTGWSTTFCTVLRHLVVNKLKGRAYTKPAICKEYGIAARVYNLAESMAKAMVNSANELHILHREAVEANLEKATRAYEGGKERCEVPSKLRQRKRRVLKHQTALDNFPEKPRIFVGGKKYYYTQPQKKKIRKQNRIKSGRKLM